MTDLLQIVKQNELFKRLRWVCLAVAPNSKYYPALKFLCVEKQGKRVCFTGCDSYRVHRFTADIEDSRFEAADSGLYAISKNTKSVLTIYKSDCAELYPDVAKFFLEDNDYAKSVPFTYFGNIVSTYSVYAAAIRLLAPNLTLNAQLFADLLSAELEEAEITLNITSVSGRIIIKAGDLAGVLLPMKIQDENLIIEDHNDSEPVLDGADLLN